MEDYWIQIIAKNSIGHRNENEFLWYLEQAILDLEIIEEPTDPRHSWDVAAWREHILNGHNFISGEELDKLDNHLCEVFSEYAEEIASVSYDHEGPAHSGSNSVYELCGVYMIEGSDFMEGPTTDKDKLLEYLDTENEDHDVFWSEDAN